MRALRRALTTRAAVITAVAALSIVAAVSCGPAMPSDEQILRAVQQSQPTYFDSDGHSKLHIVKVVQPQPGWYVAAVKVDEAGETGKIILRQQDPPSGPLSLVAGPGTAFPPEHVSLPDAVRKAL